MIVWLVNPFSNIPGEGGVEGRFTALARILVEKGHNVKWFSANFNHRKKSQRTIHKSELGYSLELLPVLPYKRNIGIQRIKSHQSFGKAFDKRAAELTSKIDIPNVIHLSVPPLDCVNPAFQISTRTGCRVTIDIMDLWPETFTRLIPGTPTIRDFVGRVLFRKQFRIAHEAYSKAHGVSAVSDEYLNLVRTLLPSQRLHLCYVGSQIPQQIAKPPDETKPVCFVYVGSITKTYDIETVFEAARRLKDKVRPFQLAIAGVGDSLGKLKSEAVKKGISKLVTFHGFLDSEDFTRLLSNSHVGLNVICRGTYITMPHKLSDYLCSGLAVINSLEGESANLLRQHSAGLSYLAGDVGALASIMKVYLEKHEVLEAHQMGARKLASKLFDRSRTFPEWADWITHDPLSD